MKKLEWAVKLDKYQVTRGSAASLSVLQNRLVQFAVLAKTDFPKFKKVTRPKTSPSYKKKKTAAAQMGSLRKSLRS